MPPENLKFDNFRMSGIEVEREKVIKARMPSCRLVWEALGLKTQPCLIKFSIFSFILELLKVLKEGRLLSHNTYFCLVVPAPSHETKGKCPSQNDGKERELNNNNNTTRSTQIYNFNFKRLQRH